MDMNNKMNFFTTCFLGVAAMAIASCAPKGGSLTGPETAIGVIHQRTSIREYHDRTVSRELLEELVRAGMAAPSAMNKQPWHFVVIEDRDVLQALGDIPTSKMVKQAPAAILVCGNLQKAGEGWLEQYWIQDCSAASQNILLATTGLGLGGVWTSVYPAENRMEIVSRVLNLPAHLIPLNIIPVGYPAEKKKPMDKWKPENVQWGVFADTGY